MKTHTIPSPDGSSSVKTMAGGSLANTVRGLSAGFGVSCGIIGAYGDDDQGQLFVNNMSSNGVNISRMREKKGLTGQVSFTCTTSSLAFVLIDDIAFKCCWYDAVCLLG